MPNALDLVKLPVADRLALIDELWASISVADVSVDPAQASEARARWAELKGDPALGLSYDELRSRLG